MEHEHLLNAAFGILIFFLIIIISLLVLYLVKLNSWYCNCEICKTYISSSWSPEFSNLCDWITFLLQNSSTMTIHIHVIGNTITANPDNVEHMLKTRFENYPKGKTFSSILGDLLGRGIFNVDGNLWKFQRNMVSLEFGRTSLKSYALEVVNYEIGRTLIPLLSCFASKKGTLDLQGVFRRFTFDCVCQFSFGLDPKCLELPLPMLDFVDSFDLASNLSAQRAMVAFPWVWKLKRVFGIGNEKKLREAIKIINVVAQGVIKQKRRKEFSTHNDLLSRFMAIIDDEKYLRDIIVSLILAGRDTVASSLTSLFMLLANHPHVESAILSEIDNVIGVKTEITSIAQMEKLHYLHATVYESMRLYPPIQFNSKFCLEDDVLPDGMFVKKGTRVTYHPYAMGRIEEIWGRDCLEFMPERWLRDGVFFQGNLFKYPVFQAGTRICLGKEIAILEIKSATISLLRRFHIKMGTSTQRPKFSPGLTATFSGGLPVSVSEKSGLLGKPTNIKITY